MVANGRSNYFCNMLVIWIQACTLVMFSVAISPASGQPAIDDYATPQQREDLATVSRSLCTSERRPPLRSSIPEVNEYIAMLRAAKSTKEVLVVSNLALETALNRLGEGEATTTWNLLCSVLDARIRVLGAAAPRTVAVINNFAVLLRKQGYVADARGILQKLESIVRKYPIEGASLTRTVLHNLGTTLAMQGYHEQAEVTLRRSLTYASATNDTTPTLTNIARTLEAQNKWSEAEQLHRDIFDKRKQQSFIRHLDRAATLNNLGANLTSQGRARDGEAFIREGLRIWRAELGPDHLNVGYSLATLVHNLLEQDRARDAEPFAQDLLRLRQRALGRDHSETAEAHRLLAEVAMGLGSTGEALASARAALESSLRLTAREIVGLDDEAKVVSRREPANAAFTLVAAAWSAGGTPVSSEVRAAPPLMKEAFLATQRISTSSTFEALLAANARHAAAVDGSGSLVEQYERELAVRMQLDAALASAAAKGEPLNRLQFETTQLERKNAATSAQLRARFPAYFDLIRPEPVPLESVASWLRPDEVLFVITPGINRRHGFVWAVTREDVVWSEVQITADRLRASIAAFRQILDPGNAAAGSLDLGIDRSWTVGYELYNALFSSPRLAELASRKPRWILAPQGVLMSLPFNALLLAAPEVGLALRPSPEKLRAMQWLGLEKILSVVPSVGSLRVLRGEAASLQPSQPFFGLGDPYFPDSRVGRLLEARSMRGVSASDLETLRQLDPLPGTRLEIRQLAQLLRAPRKAYLLGREANERELWKRSAAGQILNSRVLVFATHGLMGGELGESLPEPSLVLSPPKTPSPADDGVLTASEVRRMKIRAEWVLLSACNTAAGSRMGAEGLTGLARSFLYAGARSLLISHWRVADAVAPRISGRAIQTSQMASSPSRASAVHQTMYEVMHDTSRDDDELTTFAHPAAWAAFTFIGVD